MSKNFEFRSFDVFGLSSMKNKLSWRHLLKQEGGFDAFKKVGGVSKTDLDDNIEASYYCLVGIVLEDLDSSIQYFLSFVNGKKMWALDLANVENPKSPDVEVDPKFKVEFFHDDFIKKVIARSYDVLLDSKKLVENELMPHVEAGELLDVDETKLEAILHFLGDQQLMNNLKKAIYLK